MKREEGKKEKGEDRRGRMKQEMGLGEEEKNKGRIRRRRIE